ncbi:hypothetical protein AVEN_31605-1 [Araneus ventricosus]|uniref:Uncharacterized protein n=1 Tax=Araneus ventricosus TaxID=182803 RepID=A0A4Y2SW80_ARAVE|nr:hypothetical protein AVEN_31605-1 [Araneus ventricosus]
MTTPHKRAKGGDNDRGQPTRKEVITVIYKRPRPSLPKGQRLRASSGGRITQQDCGASWKMGAGPRFLQGELSARSRSGRESSLFAIVELLFLASRVAVNLGKQVVKKERNCKNAVSYSFCEKAEIRLLQFSKRNSED